jgi:wobble nucleotide-excising tRNase
MIESITLSGIATYSHVTPEAIQNLKALNYFYGANGAGKTTISRLINNPALSTASKCGFHSHPATYSMNIRPLIPR